MSLVAQQLHHRFIFQFRLFSLVIENTTKFAWSIIFTSDVIFITQIRKRINNKLELQRHCLGQMHRRLADQRQKKKYKFIDLTIHKRWQKFKVIQCCSMIILIANKVITEEDQLHVVGQKSMFVIGREVETNQKSTM